MKPHAFLRQSKLMRSLVSCSQNIRVHQVSTDAQTISITLQTISPTARCPGCSAPSKRVHSRYTRILSDLPWGSFTVQLHLYARKYFCTVRSCSRRIFTERLPDIVAPYARRSNRLGEILQLIGFALGGEAGSRLVERLRMTISPSTLLRLVRRAPDSVDAQHTPRVLGVDDFATRKGRTYGTILVDLEQHRPIELLPDRSAQALENWLRKHPGVEIISRDRSTEYTKGATVGAPDAIHQIADRFHLLMNLREAVERLLDRNRSQFRGIVTASSATSSTIARSSGSLNSPTLRLQRSKASVSSRSCRTEGKA